jgi:hypothetical protein
MTPEDLRARKNNMFATKQNIDIIIDEMVRTGNNAAVIYVMLAVNTVLEALAVEMEEE